MKKLLFAILCIICVCGCSSKNERLMKQASQLIEEASYSPEKEMQLPFGFKFGWTEEEAKRHIDSLKQKHIIISDSFPQFSYKYPTYKGLKANVELFFFDSTLYRMAFQHIYEIEYISESSQEYKEILLKYLYGSKRLEYKIPVDEIENEDNWDEVYLIVKSNLVMLHKRIKYSTFLQEEKVFVFSNQPKAKNYSDYKTRKEIMAGKDRFNEIRKAENWIKEHESEINASRYKSRVVNGYDGSVWQVEEYLKQNLKDPDSYESIEWGNVTSNDQGYFVKHKYRAKNSFGGYVIETQVFQIDMQGNIVPSIK